MTGSGECYDCLIARNEHRTPVPAEGTCARCAGRPVEERLLTLEQAVRELIGIVFAMDVPGGQDGDHHDSGQGSGDSATVQKTYALSLVLAEQVVELGQKLDAIRGSFR